VQWQLDPATGAWSDDQNLNGKPWTSVAELRVAGGPP
jgi:hypothetical protein